MLAIYAIEVMMYTYVREISSQVCMDDLARY